MKPVDQEFPIHDPERGMIGDCFRAALASLLGLPLASVPHFMKKHWPDELEAKRAVGRFLSNKGLILLEVKPVDFKSLHFLGHGDCYHLIFGIDHEGDGHACVGLNGRIVHDPHPLRRGMANHPSEFVYGFLVKAGTTSQTGAKQSLSRR